MFVAKRFRLCRYVDISQHILIARDMINNRITIKSQVIDFCTESACRCIVIHPNLQRFRKDILTTYDHIHVSTFDYVICGVYLYEYFTSG